MFELKILEFNKILNRINDYAVLDNAKRNISKLTPLTDRDEVLVSLSLTDEMKTMIERLGGLDITYYQFDSIVDRIRLESVLNENEFVELIKLISNSNRIISYFHKAESLSIDISEFKKHYSNINNLDELKKLILSQIDEDGYVLDTASSSLYSIRKQIRLLDTKIVDKFNEILKNDSQKLSENIITIRNGHRVIPVKKEYKNSIKGIIYDESQSGLTVYIEPYKCQELENEITIKKQEERKEIDRILSILSSKVHEYKNEILTNNNIVNVFDFVHAKAKYSLEINGIKPIISDDINLIDARHPLIDKDLVVPNTIELKKNNIMVITGPNTGGKTVVLKTVGLLSIMSQCGILIPAKEGSSIPIFTNIFADIGDEQSIEQSLSTFSSHMKKIVSILDNIEEGSLILFDELGSGTDPKEGASLAISIIDYIKNKNIYSFSTTHYPELKAYAYNNDNVINASVEFDVSSLKPTYKLLIGTPGRSNALLISKRLGLKEEIIENAKSISLDFSNKSSNLINKLEKESNLLRKERNKVQDIKIKLNKERDELETNYKNLLDSLNKDKEEFEVNKNKILIQTQKESLKLLDEIKQIKKEISNGKEIKLDQLATLTGKVNKLYVSKEVVLDNSNKDIKVDDKVRIIEYNEIAIVTKIKDNKYYCSMGSINSIFEREQIELLKESKKTSKFEPKRIKTNESNLKLDHYSTLNIIGLRYEEAYEELDKFVDSCLQTNLELAKVIHGFGSLTLRNMVINYAKSSPIIKKYRGGDESEGGNGVTVLYFR